MVKEKEINEVRHRLHWARRGLHTLLSLKPWPRSMPWLAEAVSDLRDLKEAVSGQESRSVGLKPYIVRILLDGLARRHHNFAWVRPVHKEYDDVF
eukprot:gene27067-biopygen854